MNFKRPPYSILDNNIKEIDYIKGIYKKKIQAEIKHFIDSEDQDKRDAIQTQDELVFDRFSI